MWMSMCMHDRAEMRSSACIAPFQGSRKIFPCADEDKQ